MKKLLAICLSVLLICAAMPFAFATASEEPTIVVSDVEGKAGDTVTVTVDLKNNPGLVSAVIRVGYDATALELVSLEVGEVYAEARPVLNTKVNPLVVNFCDAIAEEDYTAEEFAIITFKIKDDAAAGVYPFTLTCDYEGDFYNMNWDVIEFAEQVGAATVIGDEPAVEPSNDGYIINGDFETGDLTAWREDYPSSISDAVAHGGKYSVSSSNTYKKYDLLARQDGIAVEPGANYILTFWYYYDGSNADPSFYAYIKNDGGNVKSVTTHVGAPNTWGKVELEFNAGENSEIYVLLQNRTVDDGGTYYFDDVSIAKPKEPSFDGYMTNGDFETGNLNSWTNLWNGCTYEFVEGYESDTAISITAGSWSQIRQDGIAVEPNTDYVLSAWVKNANNFGLIIKAGDDSGDINSTYIESCGDWTEYTVKFNSGDQTAICALLIGWDGGGSAIVDNVSLAVDEGGDDPVDPPVYTEPTIVLPNIEASAGDTITVPVLFKNNPGLVSAVVKVGYDSSVLELLEAVGNFSDTGYSFGPKTKNPFTINFCDAIAESNYTGELFATLTFKVKDDAVAGTYALTLTFDCEGDFYGAGIEMPVVNFDGADGSVSVVVCAHEYDGACDPDCNLCGEIRDVHTGLIHFDAVEPGCHYIGNIEYWFCPDCEGFWADEALTQVTNSKNVILPAKGGDVVHFEAIEPGCHYNGQIEYWFCPDCEQYWQDEALTQLTNSKNVVLPYVGSENLQHVEAVAPTCQSEGNIEYWFCPDCEQYWADEALTQITNALSVKLGVLDHTIVHFDAVEPGCHYIGNIEYWFCSACEGFWQDEALTQVTNSKNVIVPAKGGDVIHFEAIEPGCHYNGQIEHWYCPECDQFWQDEALTQITNSKNVVLPYVGSENLQHVEAVAPTCQSEGNIEYWFCPDCEQYWADEALTQITNALSVKLGVIDHTIVHFDAVEPACHYNGNIEYWFCSACEGFWADEALTQVTNSKNIIVPAKGGDVIHFEAIEPGCHYNGQIEHWYCPECDQFWQDEALTQLTNSKNVVLPYVGSENLQHVEAVAPTCSEAGNIEYWYCPDCEQYWQDEALTQLTNVKNVVLAPIDHTIVHFDAVEPGCHYNGNIEYWFCSACEGFWQDEALTRVTNSKNVIVPAKGGDVVHFEAIEPGCHYNGQIEHWYCPECNQFWADEALTQLTNSKNVVLPYVGSENLQHVEAKDPTCSEGGNIEYWFCPDCEQYWQDEALTQLTNVKNVQIAPIAHTIVHFDAVEPGCHYNGNIEYWFCSVCEGFWADEALTQVTNSKNIIVPAKGGDVVHFEAIAPGCHYNGQIEYWFCAECNQFWADEALTQLTNSKNVIVPATGSDKLQHVEAKDATATENGNIEYWFCPDCEQYWTDAALTQVSNVKNVIVPATGSVDPDSPITGDSVVPVVVALLTLIASGVAVSVLKNKKRA